MKTKKFNYLKAAKIAVGVIFLFCLAPACFSRETSLKQLIVSPQTYDQKQVSFYAEVIGEPLFTESGKWFNVVSSSYYLSVFVKDSKLVEKIKHWGGYGVEGDIVYLQGVFYKDCPAHKQKVFYLSGLEIAQRGQKIKEKVSWQKKNAAFASLIICLTMAMIYLIKAFWQKKKENNAGRI